MCIIILNSQIKTLSVGGEVPLTAAALPRWTATAIHLASGTARSMAPRSQP